MAQNPSQLVNKELVRNDRFFGFMQEGGGSMFSKSDPRLVLIQEYAPHMLGIYQDIKNYQEALFDKYIKQDNTSEMAAVYDVETKRLNDVLDGYLAIKQHPDYLMYVPKMPSKP